MRRSDSLRRVKVRRSLQVERLEGRTLLSAQIDNPQLNQLVSSLGGPIQVPETVAEVANQRIVATPGAPITSNVVAGQQSGELTLATFTDPDLTATANDYRALIFWGDNTTSLVTPDGPTNGQFTVTAHHTFQTAGPQNVKVMILDTDSATTSTLVQFQPTLLTGAVDANPDNAATVQVPVTVSPSTAVQALTLQGGTVFAPSNRQFIHPVGLLTVNNAFGTTTATGTTTSPLNGLQAFIDWGDGTSSPGLIAFTNGFENGFRNIFTASPTSSTNNLPGTTTGTPTNALTFFIIGAHRYRRRGLFTVMVNVINANGDMATTQSAIISGRPTRAELNTLAMLNGTSNNPTGTMTGNTTLTTARTSLALTLASHLRSRVRVAMAHPTHRHPH